MAGSVRNEMQRNVGTTLLKSTLRADLCDAINHAGCARTNRSDRDPTRDRKCRGRSYRFSLRYINDLVTYFRLIHIFANAIGEFDGENGVLARGICDF